MTKENNIRKYFWPKILFHSDLLYCKTRTKLLYYIYMPQPKIYVYLLCVKYMLICNRKLLKNVFHLRKIYSCLKLFCSLIVYFISFYAYRCAHLRVSFILNNIINNFNILPTFRAILCYLVCAHS